MHPIPMEITPKVKRVDLIVGEVTGQVEDRSTATNPTTKVVKRFTEKDWKQDGEYIEISYTLKGVDKDSYIRLRGTNTDQLEPVVDPRGEDPWMTFGSTQTQCLSRLPSN